MQIVYVGNNSILGINTYVDNYIYKNVLQIGTFLPKTELLFLDILFIIKSLYEQERNIRN